MIRKLPLDKRKLYEKLRRAIRDAGNDPEAGTKLWVVEKCRS